VLDYFNTTSKRSTTADTLRDLLTKAGFKVQDLDPESKHKKIKARYCVICGKIVKKPQVTFCSAACVQFFITHFQWAGIVRTMMKRDNSKCLDCSGSASEVHHVVRLKDGGTNQYLNLISLCHVCHKKRHHEAFRLIREKKRLEREMKRFGNTRSTNLDNFTEET
jgi:hypothetical protein